MTAKTTKRTLLHTGKIFKMFSTDVTLDNGRKTTLDIITHPGAAAIIPVIDKDTVIMLYQYRHALGKNIWEIPAGLIEPHESASVCAKRELTEETGYIANSMEFISKIAPCPGYSNEMINIYIAKDLTETKQNLDNDEIIQVHKISFSKAFKMISAGEIVDSKTISGLFMAKSFI